MKLTYAYQDSAFSSLHFEDAHSLQRQFLRAEIECLADPTATSPAVWKARVKSTRWNADQTKDTFRSSTVILEEVSVSRRELASWITDDLLSRLPKEVF